MFSFRNGDDAALTRADRFRAEVESVRREAARHVRIAHIRSELWAYIDVALGFPAALLAGISGAAGLATADARVPAAVLALLAAGFSAGAGFLRSSARRVANKRARHAWAAVEAEARVVLARYEYDDNDLDPDAVQEALRSLFACRQAALVAYEGDDSET